MRELFSGMIVSGYLVVALFFLKFWTRTHDRLFVVFAGAFALLALQRALLHLWADDPAAGLWLYGLRLIGFSLILVAILNKNRQAPARPRA